MRTVAMFRLIDGEKFSDERGILKFFNTFNMATIKRFYVVENSSCEVIRAWQGHKKEHKFFYVLSGRFQICLIKIDNWSNPSENLHVHEVYLNASDDKILHIPGGYVNGFRSTEPNSKLMIFSTATLEESIADDIRFDKKRWFNW